MKTTNLFVELVVVGSGTFLFLLLVIFALFDTKDSICDCASGANTPADSTGIYIQKPDGDPGQSAISRADKDQAETGSGKSIKSIYSELDFLGSFASSILAISLIYLLGAVMDKFSYFLFKDKEDKLRKKIFNDDDKYTEVRHQLYTGSDNQAVIDSFEFGRSKVRIFRGWVVNSGLLLITIIIAMIAEWPILSEGRGIFFLLC